MDKVHSKICENCNLEFKSDYKLNNHMCRIEVRNPTCGDSYLKNWIIFDGCSIIFSRNLKKEIVYLHSQKCIDGVNSCPDLLPGYDSDIINYDGEIWHAPLDDFFSDGEVKWRILKCKFGINIQRRNTYTYRKN